MTRAQSAITQIGLSQLPRLAGLMDRSNESRTYGCADRHFWHYRVTDFSNARMQEMALAFVIAYQVPLEGNRFYQKAVVKEWVKAASAFWVKKAHANGAVDESYPGEKHFCATAFGVWSLSEAFLVLKEPLTVSLDQSGEFLMRHHNEDVANQTAAAAAALYNLHTLTQNPRYKIGFEEKMALLSKLQGVDGGFMEYGGFDCGYNSITLSLLADLYQKNPDPHIKQMAQACLRCLEQHIKDDGTFDINVMSRRTQFLYPSGFKVFASPIYQKILTGLTQDAILNPVWMDDRYCVPLTNDYLLCSSIKDGA